MNNQNLPAKEANLFKLVVKSYETKQYKKGVKAADQILKKFANHGETLSMKGLLLNCLERKAEAYELVKMGLKNDLKSHVCWHVYGLLYRSDRDYREAIKCYRNALRIDPENIQILRDLSLLQAQMRDSEGFVETRQTLLTLKPGQRNNWIGFALAHHINNNPTMAVQILDAYEGTLEDEFPPSSERYEHSEMLLYKAMVLEEAGSLKEALSFLEKSAPLIVDKISLREQKAELLLKLKRPAEAEKVYRELVAINPDNYRFFRGLQSCLGLKPNSDGTYNENSVEYLTKLYSELNSRYPSSSAVKRIPLDFLLGSKFEESVDAYMRPKLRKGVPSLFSDLKSLYSLPGKADAIEEILHKMEVSLRSTDSFFPTSLEPEPIKEGPSTLLWLLFFTAQHFDRRGLHKKGLDKIEEAIQHTPTVIDLYLVKARILKHCGDFTGAAALADEARKMDLADRYLNSEAVKRMLQADQVPSAEKVAALFTKDGEQHEALVEMQCMWYELESGDSHLRQGNFGKALKKYLSVHKHYNDMMEDQFDFHTYCVRKMTLRAYVAMLRFEDRLHSYPFFKRGAQGAIRTYLELFKSPTTTHKVTDEETLANMSAADRKRYRQKQRKAEARAKKDSEDPPVEESAPASSAANGGPQKAPVTGKKGGKPVDSDPDGRLLAQVENPLKEASRYLRLLEEHAGDDIETHFLGFEVNWLQGRLLLALKSLKRQKKIDESHPRVHANSVRFLRAVEALPAPANEGEEIVQTVIRLESREFQYLDGSLQSLEAINEDFLKKHKDSLPHRRAVAESILVLDASKKAEAAKIIEESELTTVGWGQALSEGVPTWKLKDCIEVHKFLKAELDGLDADGKWFERCRAIFPRSIYFGGVTTAAADVSAAEVKNESQIDVGVEFEEVGKDGTGVASVVANGLSRE